MLRRLIKIFHEIGACGVIGAFGACLILMASAPALARNLPAYSARCQAVAAICRWLLTPSLALVLISGLIAIAANRAYTDAGWAWLKALLGISMFEGTLLTVISSARHAADMASMASSADFDAASLAALVRTEWGGVWIMLSVALANVVLGVWRPRLVRRAAR